MRTSTRRAKPAARLNCETLEDRVTPAIAYALNDATSSLFSFDTANPNAAVTTGTAVTGIDGGEVLVGIDFRPANGLLYGLGVNDAANTATLYTINLTTAVATRVSAATGAITFTTDGTTVVDLPAATVGYGFDFNPSVDRIRVVAGTLNFRVNPNDGLPVDGNNTGTTTAVTGTNPDGTVNPAGISLDATAYTNSRANTGGPTTQYTIDSTTAGNSRLFIQNPPGAGTQVLQGTNLGFDFSSVNGFDIPEGATPTTGFAVATVGGVTALYAINLTAGTAALSVGTGLIGAGTTAIRGFALQPAGTIQFQNAAQSGTEGTGGINVVLTRTGGTTGAITATVTVTGGTATEGVDFGTGPYTVMFADGVSTATLNIPFLDDATAEGPETLTLAITAVTAGAIGTQATTTLTVADSPQRFNQVFGTASGAPLVAVVPSGSTTPTVFNPYAGLALIGGVRVAAGDVNGDGIDDLVTINAVGAPLVKVFSGANGNQIASFQAYPTTINIPASLAVGDVNNDGFDDIILSTATTIGAVQVYNGRDFSKLVEFFPFGGLPVGFNVTSGDMNNDGFSDIILGTTTGLSAIGIISGKDFTQMGIFLPFGNLAVGTTVAAGDLDGDGRLDLAVGTNSIVPAVAIYNGQNITVQSTFFFPSGTVTAGASVAISDVNGDGKPDIITGPTAGPATARAFDGRTLAPLNTINPFGALAGGVFVG